MVEKQKFLMLITDCPDEQMITMRALRQGGIEHEVVIVPNGAEAAEFLDGTGQYADRNIERLPSLILFDLVSPHIEGHETLRQLRDHPKSQLIPIIILTSSFRDADLGRSLTSGANSLVLKPQDARGLAETLGHVARYWLYINRTAP